MKTTLLLFISLLFAFGIKAQSFTLNLPGYAALSNGDTVTVVSTDNDVTFSVIFWVNNSTNDSKYVKVRKNVLAEVSGSVNYFCWGNCYDPPVSESIDSLLISGKGVEKGFTCDYESHGHPGKTTIRYTFFDINNSTDTVAVVVEFIAGSGVGINIAAQAKTPTAWPNPAGQILNVEYNHSGTQPAIFEIRNIIGQVVKQQNMSFGANKYQIALDELPNGIYFYQVQSNGKKTEARKLIIQH